MTMKHVVSLIISAATAVSGLAVSREHQADATSHRAACRALPGDAEWPSPHIWNTLNNTVHGRLSKVVPLPNVCHHEPYDNFNAEACAALQKAWYDDETFLSHAGEVMNPGVQNYSCVPFTPAAQACQRGEYASYAITVTGASDVAAGIKFAHDHNIRLAIKNTGHDFAGKSTGAGALTLWTHKLNTTDIIENYKSSTYQGPAIRLGAGTIGGTVYETVGKAGFRLLGGTCPTVGLAGGYTSGGGHSLLNGLYGMAADAVLEWEVVTASGEHLIATPERHSDLYWALSGGGAGTFGLILSMTTKIFKDGPIGSGILVFNISSTNVENYWSAVSDLWSFLPEFVDAGPNTWDFALTPEGFQAYAITVPDKNGTQVQELLQPFLNKLHKRGIKYSYKPTSSPDYLQYFSSHFGPGIKGAGPATVQLASRLIPRDSISKPAELKAIVKALRSFVDNKYWTLGCHALNVADIAHPPNSVLPQWRRAIATCNIVSYWNWTVPESEMRSRKHLLNDKLMPALEKATPGAGTYLNEIDYEWKGDWKTELYGENYDRLVSIKEKYDPNGAFYAWTAIGSDAWVREADGRLCKVR